MLEGILGFLNDSSFYVYLVIFLIGLAWVVLSLVLGGLADAVEAVTDLDADADSWGHRQVGLSPFSPLMLAVFGMLFGVLGMALTVFTSWGLLPVLGVGLGAAVVLDGAVYGGIYAFFVQSQSTSMVQAGEAVGAVATVATRILPGRPGTINYDVAGRRTVAGARALDDSAYDVGDVVEIVSLEGGMARVRRRAADAAAGKGGS